MALTTTAALRLLRRCLVLLVGSISMAAVVTVIVAWACALLVSYPVPRGPWSMSDSTGLMRLRASATQRWGCTVVDLQTGPRHGGDSLGESGGIPAWMIRRAEPMARGEVVACGWP